MRLAQGTRLGHYEVISPLGKGGMGEVYLAQDVRLGRRVALKVLPAAFADDQDSLARFIREARAASALNHPNIITIHDIGDAAGTYFIAYEFVDGRTLRDVARSAPLDAATAIDIGIQVASALADAHRAGIVHRDLKPDNVMIRATGLVKLLDFGIARLSRPAEADVTSVTAMPGQTLGGMLIGTPQYMSPEQARGLEVDQQTDLFSFGALLYELLSGTSPFAAGTATDIIVAVLTREPPPLTKVPPAVADIVSRALQKDRAQRYATAAELLLDLTNAKQALGGDVGRAAPAARQHADTPPQLATAGSTATPRAMTSLAVLPFANMSADVDNEHFCDGLAEELLNALSKIDALKVAARTSAFTFKGKTVDVGTIARTLGVTSVLDGSIRRSGNRLRISVQLVNAADGYQVWSERYDREMRDVFELQDEITLAVVAALKLKLFGEERAAVLKRYTDNAEAYELFLKGRHHSYKYTAQGWQRAIEFFEKAIALQPDYALAYAGIAASRGCQWFFGILPAEQVIPQCKADQRAGAGHRRRPCRRISLAVDDHVLLRLGLARRRAGVHPVDRAQPEQQRGPVVLRVVSRLRWARGRGHGGQPEGAGARPTRAAHQHERRLDLLRRRTASRGVAAGREDDRERSGFLRRLLAAGRHSSERRRVPGGGRPAAERRVARRSSGGGGRPGVGLQPGWRHRRGHRHPRPVGGPAAAALRASHLPGARLQPAREHHDGDRVARGRLRRTQRGDGVPRTRDRRCCRRRPAAATGWRTKSQNAARQHAPAELGVNGFMDTRRDMTTSFDEQGIREAITFYAEGMRTGDVETLKRGFHEQAILCGYLGDDLIAGPIAELYDWVAANPAPAATGDPFSCETLGIEMTGRVATARVRESDHHGVVIDHFHLLKVGERWSIVSKLWDAEP